MTAGGLDFIAGAAGVRLILARHGQTPSNVRSALDTLPPGPGLTEEGLAQAYDLVELLATEKVMAVHASRAIRAQETAAPLASRFGLDVEVLDGIQEIYVGELEGSAHAQARQHFEDVYASWHLGKLDRPMPDGETGRQALTRFLDAARPVVTQATAGTIVLVSHGAMLRLVANHLTTDVDGSRANAAYLPNTGTIVLESSQNGWECLAWDGLK